VSIVSHMVRICGALPRAGIRHQHGHTAPLHELPVVTHVTESICSASHVREPHAHEVFEFCYVLAGKGLRVAEDVMMPVGPGDMYIIRPGEMHSARADAIDPYHYFAIGLAPGSFPIGNVALEECEWSKNGRTSAGTGAVEDILHVRGQRLIHDCAGAELIFRRILLELDRDDDCDRSKRALTVTMVQALMVELLVFISRCSMFAEERLETRSQPLRRPIRAEFQELLRCLRSRLVAPPSLNEMAAQINLSPAHLTVAFKREVGQTPLEYITSLRVDEACRRLINEPQMSVTDIAAELGFSASQYFSQVFRKQRGCTPSQWRARNAKLS
jgi:AraC-like DNA-binding protein/mannose-6-phosphate isomerase-like protein (cupin superfamily)